jgi:ATP-dependent Lon protease
MTGQLPQGILGTVKHRVIMKGKNSMKFNNLIVAQAFEEDGEFIPLISEEDEDEIKKVNMPEVLPILPLKNTVLFPGVVFPITVGRNKSLTLVKEVYAGDKILGAISQRDPEKDDVEQKDLYKLGTIAQILKILEMPDGSISVIIQGKRRFNLNAIVKDEPYFKASVELLDEIKPAKKDQEYNALVQSLKDVSLKIIKLSSNIPNEASFAVKNIESPEFLINFICANSNLELSDKQTLLEISSLKDRSIRLLEFLTREVQMLELKNDIQTKVKLELDRQQREYMLHQQMKTIQDELGGSPVEQEVEDLKKRAAEKKWNEATEKVFAKELEKLQRMNPAVAEYSVQMNYLQVLLDLPWNEYSKDNFDLTRAQTILDNDHYGLEQVKERILEHLAVLKLKGDMKSPILCLYGPPGVGKTSLGKSVAKALDRAYIRMSLGGMRDEAEIRGHRKTYIGAMPGRIIQSVKKAKYSNPVFILDEIDKVGADFRGDPSSALLEVLDPEQNSTFHDNFLEVEYDLSRVLFIATANTVNTISPALRDRMEMIEISGYLVEEKVEIAKRHLIPKQFEAHGLKKNTLTFSKKILERIIEDYTRESGVRELDKKIAKIIRSVAKDIAFEKEINKKLTLEDIRKILGVPQYLKDIYGGNDYAGVVTGLAWTPVGGQILFVETSLSQGKGRLTLTGSLGDVMKESAVIAHEYLKGKAEWLDLPGEVFDHWNVHVHVPEGAIPKDGPSAGIAMVSSIASAFTQRKVRKYIAMTGEMTLRGKVLPVGGIKEKILAAKRASIKDIILSKDNKKDLEEIKEDYLKGLTFHFVDEVMEVIDIVLLKQKVKTPKPIGIPEYK